LRKKKLRLKDFLFGDDVQSLSVAEKKKIKQSLSLEIQEVFECKNLGGR